VLGVAVVLGTVLVAASLAITDLTAVLLVVLVEVLVVAVLSGPVLAAVAALVAVVLVNWFLVPPYRTFQVASVDNLVALMVFGVVAVSAAFLVEVSGRARARAARASAQAGLLGDVVAFVPDEDPTAVLERIRSTLGLDRVVLSQDGPETSQLLATVGVSSPDAPPTLHVTLDEGYHLVAYGADRLGANPAFLASLGAAAVRAYEGGLLDQEQRRVADLSAIDHARTALLASVGHDLRTPLAGLRVTVDSLRTVGDDLTPDDRAALLDNAMDTTLRLEELITNLLDMSRLEAGALVVQPQQTRVEEVVARALVDLGDHQVTLDVPETLPTVTTDPVLLERILANLISNALRHGGGSPVAIDAGLDGGGRILIEVVDHGPGIQPGHRPDLYRPFQRAGDRTAAGTGLGLAIARGFAVAIHAELDLRETDGGGVTARVTLPQAGSAP
jgi:K+-sensing histidine kinase KdpD